MRRMLLPIATVVFCLQSNPSASAQDLLLDELRWMLPAHADDSQAVELGDAAVAGPRFL